MRGLLVGSYWLCLWVIFLIVCWGGCGCVDEVRIDFKRVLVLPYPFGWGGFFGVILGLCGALCSLRMKKRYKSNIHVIMDGGNR